VLGRRVSDGLGRELRLLQRDIGSSAHPCSREQLEHRSSGRGIRQADELELVAHRSEFALELRDRCVVKLFLQLKDGEQL
jgi:hypothetical protein